MKRGLIIIICSLLFAGVGFAGGSYEPVIVSSFISDGDTFTVVVIPQKNTTANYSDPFMGKCEHFTVIGSHSSLWWAFRSGGPSKETHRKAIEKLSVAYRNKEIINFGWMGTGFKVLDPRNPCVVGSKGLELYRDESGYAVISYYYGI